MRAEIKLFCKCIYISCLISMFVLGVSSAMGYGFYYGAHLAGWRPAQYITCDKTNVFPSGVVIEPAEGKK